MSTIREERESVSSTEAGATPNRAEVTTGAELLAQLHLKNRLQRHLELSATSSDDSSDEAGLSDDDEDVLVVDLKGKRAILMEGQSPKFKAAMAAEDYDSIFGVEPAPHVMLNVKEVVRRGFLLFNFRNFFIFKIFIFRILKFLFLENFLENFIFRNFYI